MEHSVKYINQEAQDNVLSVLDQFASSSEGIAKFAGLMITEVEEGRVDALRIALFMKTMEKIKEQVNEKLTEYYVTEAQKHPGKSFNYRGADISIAEHGTKYNYSSCGHPQWNDLTRVIDIATKNRTEIESLLKALKAPHDFIIDDEVVNVKPPVKTSKTGINISIK